MLYINSDQNCYVDSIQELGVTAACASISYYIGVVWRIIFAAAGFAVLFFLYGDAISS